MKRTAKVFQGTLASILQLLVATALQIVLMPIILRTAGQETLGVYAIIIQIIGYLALLDIGITTALVRSLSQSLDNPTHFRTLMNSTIVFMVLIGAVYALLGTILAFGLRDLFQLSDPLATQSRTALLWLAAWGLLRFPLAVYPIALTAIQDLSIPPMLGAVTNAIRMVLSMIAVQSGLSIQGLVAANILSECLYFGVLLLRFRRLRPGWSIQLRNFDMTSLKELLRFGFKAVWGNIAGRIVLQTDNIMVGYIYSAVATSIYYNTQTPVTILSYLVLYLAGNATPAINELWARHEWEKLRDIFIRLQRLTMLMVVPIIVGGWFYLESTVRVWVGSDQFAGQAMTLWLVLFAAMFTTGHVAQIFVYASGDITRFSQLTSLEAVANLVLSFVFGRAFGLHGVALATTVTRIPTLIYLQIKTHNDLKVTFGEWAQKTLLPVSVAAIPTGFTAALLVNLAPPHSWGSLILHFIIIGIVHLLSVFLFGLTTADRKAAVKLITRKSFTHRSEEISE